MTTLPADAAYRLWSATYDSDPNPILALEHRVLRERLAIHPGMRVVDLATGTGRWLEYAVSQGANAFGIDLSREMLAQAARKSGLGGRLVQANVHCLPFHHDFADLAVCSFSLAYFHDLDVVFREMARIARRIVVSDLYPDAIRAGWIRSFRADGLKYEIAHHNYSRSSLSDSARAAGLAPRWNFEASFEESERVIFERAGKGDAFGAAARIPAVFISCWERP